METNKKRICTLKNVRLDKVSDKTKPIRDVLNFDIYYEAGTQGNRYNARLIESERDGEQDQHGNPAIFYQVKSNMYFVEDPNGKSTITRKGEKVNGKWLPNWDLTVTESSAITKVAREAMQELSKLNSNQKVSFTDLDVFVIERPESKLPAEDISNEEVQRAISEI